MNGEIGKAFKSKLIFGKYLLKYLIAKGSFGEVYMGTNIFEKKNYALKIEKSQNCKYFLKEEAYTLLLVKGPGIPSMISFGVSNKYHILVEELLGESIQALWLKNKNKFNLKDTCMFAIQALERIEYIHSKNFLHRDIKPGNFLVGNPDKSQIYLIDFGNAKKFRSSRTGKYNRYNNHKIYGTMIFLSLNVLKGGEQTRKDELEALGLLFIYLFQGFLPWSKLQVKDMYQALYYVKILKQKTSLKDLCSQMPSEMYEYMDYVYKLKYDNNPNYVFLRSLFLNILRKIGEKNDLMFSWIDKNITPNKIKIKSSNKSKIFKKIYNNILSNSNKNISIQNSNKNELNKENIFSKNQNRSGALNLNMTNKNSNSNLLDNQFIYINDNEKKININKKTIDIEHERSNNLCKKENIPKTLKNNSFMRRNNTNKGEHYSQKIRLIKKEKKLNLTNLGINNQKSLINGNTKRYETEQNYIENQNSYFSKVPDKKPDNINTKNKRNLKLKSYILGINNQKNVNGNSRNQKFININNININKFLNNNYTYVTIIKNPDTQKINISNKNTKYILTDSDYQNSINQNLSTVNYKPNLYKSIFTSEPIFNSNIKIVTKKLIKRKSTSNINKLNFPQEKIKKKLNVNMNKEKNLINQRNLKNQSYTKGKIKSYKPLFNKGDPQTFNNSPKKINIF